MSSVATKMCFKGGFLIYIKYSVCDGTAKGQHRAANTARDYILKNAFGIESTENLISEAPGGKPYIEGVDFDFSTAHTGNVAIAAACGNGEKKEGLICIDKDIQKIGIDIECENRKIDGRSIKRICEKVFSEKEREYVNVGTPGEVIRFLEVWTKKESIVKATGEGLARIHNADSFGKGFNYLKTEIIEIDNKKYIVSIAGI